MVQGLVTGVTRDRDFDFHVIVRLVSVLHSTLRRSSHEYCGAHWSVDQRFGAAARAQWSAGSKLYTSCGPGIHNREGRGTADFIPVVAWRKSAKMVSMHLSKGRLVAVEGRLYIRFYKAQDGRRQKAAEVVANRIQFLDRKKGKDVLTVEQPTIDAETDTGAEDAPA